MDTVEHYVSNVHVAATVDFEAECEQDHQAYYDMFEMASKMIDKASSRKRVFISMLHTADRVKQRPPIINLYFLILTRFHSGHYPPAYQCHCSKWQVKKECKPDLDETPGQNHGLAKYAKRQFELTRIDDVTEDYRLTAIKSPNHFQSPMVHWTWPKLARLAL